MISILISIPVFVVVSRDTSRQSVLTMRTKENKIQRRKDTSMDSTSPSSKRIKTRAIRRGGRLVAWFSGEDEKIEKYLHETNRKAINNPKLISFNWLREQKLAEVRSLLIEQLLKRFLEMSGNIYLDLVRVFYTNLQFVGNNLVSHVKGVEMEITHDVWYAITGLN